MHKWLKMALQNHDLLYTTLFANNDKNRIKNKMAYIIVKKLYDFI